MCDSLHGIGSHCWSRCEVNDLHWRRVRRDVRVLSHLNVIEVPRLLRTMNWSSLNPSVRESRISTKTNWFMPRWWLTRVSFYCTALGDVTRIDKTSRIRDYMTSLFGTIADFQMKTIFYVELLRLEIPTLLLTSCTADRLIFLSPILFRCCCRRRMTLSALFIDELDNARQVHLFTHQSLSTCICSDQQRSIHATCISSQSFSCLFSFAASFEEKTDFSIGLDVAEIEAKWSTELKEELLHCKWSGNGDCFGSSLMRQCQTIRWNRNPTDAQFEPFAKLSHIYRYWNEFLFFIDLDACSVRPHFFEWSFSFRFGPDCSTNVCLNDNQIVQWLSADGPVFSLLVHFVVEVEFSCLSWNFWLTNERLKSGEHRSDEFTLNPTVISKVCERDGHVKNRSDTRRTIVWEKKRRRRKPEEIEWNNDEQNVDECRNSRQSSLNRCSLF